MLIENPYAFYYLLLLIPFWILFLLTFRRNEAGLKEMVGVKRYQYLKNIYFLKNLLRGIFFICFVLFTVLSLAEIKMGHKIVVEDRTGNDILLVLDVSNSMLAEDVDENRLQKMVDISMYMLEKLPDARFGLIIFKGKAATIFPLTEDRNVFEFLILNLSVNMMTAPGSNGEVAIKQALSYFSEYGRFQTIVLISDGEYLEGDVFSAAQLAGKMNIPIITVGIGTKEGALLNQKDKFDNPVISTINDDVLKEISSLSRGCYYSIENYKNIPRELPYIQRGLEPGEWDMSLRIEYQDMYRVFLIVAIIFLIPFIIVKAYKWRDVL